MTAAGKNEQCFSGLSSDCLLQRCSALLATLSSTLPGLQSARIHQSPTETHSSAIPAIFELLPRSEETQSNIEDHSAIPAPWMRDRYCSCRPNILTDSWDLLPRERKQTVAPSSPDHREIFILTDPLTWRTSFTSPAHGKLPPLRDTDHLPEERQRSSGSVAPQTLRCLTREHVWLDTRSQTFVPAIHHHYFFRGPFCIAFMPAREIPLRPLICNMTTTWTTMTTTRNLEEYHYRPPNEII